MRTRHSRRTRRGVSLAELLVVISSATVILTMSATLIHRIMHTQSRAYAFFCVERSALRLTTQFRRDVHSATDASIDGAGDEGVLTLQLTGDQTVEYRRAEGNVARVLSSGGDVVAREEFPFPAGTEWGLQEHQAPRRLILSLEGQPQDNLDPNEKRPSPLFAVPVGFRAEACLGRDRYFSGMAASAENPE